MTVLVFKNRKVVRRRTQEPPIFIGPMMLHGDGKRDTYKHFFVEIDDLIGNEALDANELACDGVLVGSDEEQAIVSAAAYAFRNSKHLFCMIHCKDNVRHHNVAIKN